MQASVMPLALAALLAATPAFSVTAYITNEKGNSITVVDLAKLVAVKTVVCGLDPSAARWASRTASGSGPSGSWQ